MGVLGAAGDDGEIDGGEATTDEEQEQSADADASDGSDGESDSDSDTQQDVTIVSEELQETALGWEVVVVVENTSGEMQDYIEVKPEFYDENNTRIDEWFANATDVRMASAWS